jgi:hypothetical protein
LWAILPVARITGDLKEDRRHRSGSQRRLVVDGEGKTQSGCVVGSIE